MARMVPAATLEKLLVDFSALSELRGRRSLNGMETAKFLLLQDTLLEAGMSLAAKESPFPKRSPRVAMAVVVTYRTKEGAARAVTKDIGTRGLCLVTDQQLEPGTVIALTMHVDEWSGPLETAGEVVWSSPSAMGIALRVLSTEDEARLRELVAMRINLAEQVRAMLRSRDPDESRPLVRVGASVAMALEDGVLAETSTALLALNELIVVEKLPEGTEPAVVITDEDHAAELRAKFPQAPMVLVNANGHDALSGPLSQLRISEFVRAPSSASAVLVAAQRAVEAAAIEAASVH